MYVLWVVENIAMVADAGEELTGWPPGVSTYAWLSTDKL